jgi:hypothetical protein
MQLGSMFISNCNITLHVSDAYCVHPQEYIKTVEQPLVYDMLQVLKLTKTSVVFIQALLDLQD